MTLEGVEARRYNFETVSNSKAHPQTKVLYKLNVEPYVPFPAVMRTHTTSPTESACSCCTRACTYLHIRTCTYA